MECVQMVEVDPQLNCMTKEQLKIVIRQYEKLTERLQRQVILLKYTILVESPEIELRYPLQEIVKEIDFQDIELEPKNPTIVKRKDDAYQ